MLRFLAPGLCVLFGLAILVPRSLCGDEQQAVRKPYDPKIFGPSTEPAMAIQRIRVPKGLQVSLFAAEPMLANPVCFCVDEKNRFYVAETFRLHDGVTDVRGHMDWLDGDLASRTVADRVALMKKHLGKQVKKWTVEHERIRLLEDTSGSGKADRSTVFADGFQELADGIGAGLLARDGQVWYACMPNFWLLRQGKDNKAGPRKVLHSGYGVHISFIGHDLHGLRFGPDGKIYFSCGDRGFHVQTAGRAVSCPDTGAVLRCNPDGSELEIVATGLRNPQELAFDQYGNLFTGDNNADHGDKARWVYVVEGGDSGWRGSYQYHTMPVDLGPWNAEKLWLPPWDGQAAYIVPPIANVADGPAGLTYYPGLGLPDRYQGHFFLCDFRGGSGQSGIRSLAVKPKGAAFEMVDQHEFIWSVLATDVDFGTDSCLYLTDWVEGWEKPNKGRIYKVFDPEKVKDPEVLGVKKILAEGITHRSLDELAGLLSHRDMRVRQHAQFALAERGLASVARLCDIARSKQNQLARLHALWALGQISRKTPDVLEPVISLLGDPDAEVRAQTAKILGEGHPATAFDRLLSLISDPEPRVRFFAALSAGKFGRQEVVEPVVGMLRENADRDPYLRHAGVMALTWFGNTDVLEKIGEDKAPPIRLAALLALRRLERPEVARFLNDPEPRLVLEAARAINDVPINAALPQLAALISRQNMPEPLQYRVLNANFRLGQADNAAAVAAFATQENIPEAVRIEALRELADWSRPGGRDRIMGQWRPLPPRPASVVTAAVRPALAALFRAPDKVQREAVKLVAKLQLKETAPTLLERVADGNRSMELRLEALSALETLADERLEQAMQLALADAEAKLRTAGRRVLAKHRPNEAAGVLEALLGQASVIEQQGALSILGDLKSPAADAVLCRCLDKLGANQMPVEIQLDLLEAAGRRKAPEVKDKLSAYEKARAKKDLLTRYRESLAGGDAEAGKNIFFHKAEVSCVRCHKIKKEGGEVGPDLTGIGTRQKREYLLESILDPNKEIAKGFETVVLAMSNGQINVGIVKAEDARQIRLITAEGHVVDVPKSQVEERTRGKSAMPEDVIKHLSKSEVRNLVEFLAGLK